MHRNTELTLLLVVFEPAVRAASWKYPCKTEWVALCYSTCSRPAFKLIQLIFRSSKVLYLLSLIV